MIIKSLGFHFLIKPRYDEHDPRETIKPDEANKVSLIENRRITPYKITGIPANAIGIPRKTDMICRMYGGNFPS